MRSLAATATVCICMAGAGLWWAAFARPAATPEIVRLDKPAPAIQAATPAAAGDGLDKFRGAETPKPVPSLTFTDGEGRRVDLSDLKGRVVLLNLWATWCGPCVKEMPSLDRLQAKLGGEAFQVVALSLDRGGRDVVAPFYDKTGVKSLATYLDPTSSSMKALGLRGLPTTLLVDRDGNELGRVEGAVEWDSPAVVAFLRKSLGNGGNPPGRGPAVVKTAG